MEESETIEEKKEAAQVRGVGIIKSHVYLEDGYVIVSVNDYFEGESVSVAAFLLNENGSMGNEVKHASVEESCGGRIEGIDIKTCGKYVNFPIDENEVIRVQLTYGDVLRTADISRRNRSAWLSWSE